MLLLTIQKLGQTLGIGCQPIVKLAKKSVIGLMILCKDEIQISSGKTAIHDVNGGVADAIPPDCHNCFSCHLRSFEPSLLVLPLPT